MTLRALAEHAAWICKGTGWYFEKQLPDQIAPADAAYIAAANPKAILALLDVVDAARRYFNGYVQDEAADGEMLDKGWSDDRLYSGCSRQQAIDAFALRAALAALGEGK